VAVVPGSESGAVCGVVCAKKSAAVRWEESAECCTAAVERWEEAVVWCAVVVWWHGGCVRQCRCLC